MAAAFVKTNGIFLTEHIIGICLAPFRGKNSAFVLAVEVTVSMSQQEMVDLRSMNTIDKGRGILSIPSAG